MKKILFVILFLVAIPSYSQSLESILGNTISNLGNAVTLSMILKNPNLQSADMKNYLSYYQQGVYYQNSFKYYDACMAYVSALRIMSNTQDQNLRKAGTVASYNQTLNNNLQYCINQYNAANTDKISLMNGRIVKDSERTTTINIVVPSGSDYSSNYTAPSTTTSSNSSSSQSTYTKQPQKCMRCKGGGICSRCHGSGKYYFYKCKFQVFSMPWIRKVSKL